MKTKAEENLVEFMTEPCPVCNEEHTLLVEKEQLDLFLSPNRPLIQDCFPDLAPAEREMLITGICPKCWGKMFAMFP